MSKRPRGRVARWSRLALVVALVAAVAINFIAWHHARSMTHFLPEGERTPPPHKLTSFEKAGAVLLGVRIPRPRNVRTPADLGLTFTPHKLESPGNPALELWDVPLSSPRGTVLLFHGYAASKDQLLDLVPEFRGLGWSAALVDFRGSGGSAGDTTSIGFREADDVARVLEWASAKQPDLPVVLYGFSMGAAAVMRAAGVLNVQTQGMIVEGCFGRMRTAVGVRFQAMRLPAFPAADLLLFWGGLDGGFSAFEHNPIEYARNVSVPVLVLHGSRDRLAPIAEAEELRAALAGSAQLEVFPGLDHQLSATARPERWRRVVGPFLDQVAVDSAHNRSALKN